MESIMKDEIIDYLLRHQLINPSQHGFMPNKSFATNLLEFLEKITDLFDNSIPEDVVFLCWNPRQFAQMDWILAQGQKTKNSTKWDML